MKFKCRKFDLANKLQYLEGVVEKADKEEGANCYFYFNLVGNTLWISAASDGIAVTTEMKVDTEEEGECLLNARKIIGLLKSLGDKMLTLVYDFEKQKMTLKIDKSKYIISCLDKSLFASIHMPSSWEFKIPINYIKAAISRCVPLIKGDGSSMPFMIGALFCLKEKSIEVMATDDNQLAVMACGVENDGAFQCIIPKKTWGELKKVLENCSEPYIEFTPTKNAAYFRVGSFVFRSAIVYGSMPNYSTLVANILKQNTKIYTIHRMGCLMALKRCLIFSDKNSGGRVHFDFSKHELNIRVASVKGDAASEFVQCRTDQEVDLSLQANAQYFINYMQAVEDEWVDLLVDDPEKTLIFRSEQSKDFVFIMSAMSKEG